MPTPRLSQLKPWLLIAAILLCSACSHLEYWQLNEQDKLDYLIAKHQYQKALQLINNSTAESPFHQHLQSQEPKVLNKQNTFVQQTIQQSQVLVKKHQWPQAITALTSALDDNPDQKRLSKQLNKVKESQQTFIKQQQLALANLQASQYQQRQRIFKNLLQADPQQNQIQAQKKYEQQLATNSFQQLFEEAQKATNEKNWAAALEHINKAKQINNNSDLSKLEQKVTTALRHHKQQQHNHTLNLQRLRNAQLAEKLIKQSQSKQWLEAQNTIIELQQQQHLSNNHQQLIMTTLNSLAMHISELVQKGQHSYTNGKLQQAIEYWQQAQTLAPNDENINQKLHRAQRFQQNLNKLP